MQLPVDVRPEEVARKDSLGKAIQLCVELGGFDVDKQVSGKTGIDKAQLSRMQSEIEGIKWPRLTSLMDACGNDAPLLWMLHQRGYDLHSIRKRESETQKQLREALEQRDQERAAREAVEESLRRILTGRAT